MGSVSLVSTAPPLDDGRTCNWCQVFDPESRFITNWNRIEILIGIFNVFIDLLFFYLPIATSNGIQLNFKPASVIILLRLIGDSFYLMGIILKFRISFEVPGQRVFNRRELVKDSKRISMRYLKSLFIIDLLAILPLPQVHIWYMFSSKDAYSDDHNGYFVLPCLIGLQLFPRLSFMFPWRRNLIKSSGTLMKNDWMGAAVFLLFYIMLSHFTGAIYYLMYIYRLLRCKMMCLKKMMETTNLDWDQLLSGCSMKDEMEQGMFSDAHQRKIGSRTFSQRYMYCFSWGLKCLSSMAQNFDTSFLLSETAFSFLMTICGLLLFAGLIAQMQTSIQALGNGEELQMMKQRDIEDWTKQHGLPPDLRKRVRETVLSEWRMIRSLDDEAIVNMLPLELQCEIRRHLYLELADKIPFFANMDKKLVHSFCGYIRACFSHKGSFIAVEGEPVGQMFFIVDGQLEVLFIDGLCSTSPILGNDDICGQELLSWASCPSSSTQTLPLSSRTLKCITDVEAFVISAKDLKLLAVQFEYNWNLPQAV